MAITDLRDFMQSLENENELIRIKDPVDRKFELSGYIKNSSDVEGPALLFENVKDASVPVLGALYNNRRLMLKALQTSEENAISDYLAAMNELSEPVLCDTGPCKEVIHIGDEASLDELPLPIFSELDSGAFITCGVAISKDVEDGTKNASIYRFEQQGPRQLGVYAPLPHHLGIHYQKAEANNQALEIAIAIGVSPGVQICTQWEAAYGVDELTLAGALQGKELEVVKCETVDLEVPAKAEIIIEGRILPGKRQMEGPFGEYTGYYTPRYEKPYMEITAITHRHKPILQVALTGIPPTDNHVLKMIPMEASCYAFLRQKFPGVQKVHFHTSGGVGLMGIVSIKQRFKNEARNVLGTMIAAQGTKIIIAVDEDIDIFNMDHVMWAVCTRSQADKDLIVFPRTASFQLDPSKPDTGTNTAMAIDATRPYGEEFDKVVTIPGAEMLPDIMKLWKK
jgi:2,5-furandicarboxylate decarboxylase 1